MEAKLQRPNALRRFAQGARAKLLNLDQFGENFSMKMEKDMSSLPTWMGTLFSIVLIFIVAAYSCQKIDILVNRKDVDIVTASIDSFFDQDYVFDYDAGLNIAFAFTSYDGTNEMPIDDPSIVEVVFNSFQWGEEAAVNGEYFAGRSRI